jgi:hypothetical protein
MATFMAAVENTIVATAMPTIVSDLGNFHLFTWVFAAYLSTQAVTVLMGVSREDVLKSIEELRNGRVHRLSGRLDRGCLTGNSPAGPDDASLPLERSMAMYGWRADRSRRLLLVVALPQTANGAIDYDTL